jgi:hypothetical protein
MGEGGTKQRFVQEDLEVALTGSSPRERPERRCLDGKGEALLIALACSKAPDGHQRWTVRLLADRMVQLEHVEHISPETVRTTLKKTNSSRGSKNPGAFQRQGLARNIASMEGLCRQVQNWQDYRNQQVGTVNWQFCTADAHIKLKRLYPVTG